MRLHRTATIRVALAAMLLAAGSARAGVEVGWNGSTRVWDHEKGYAIRFGGRIMNDWVFNSPDDSLGAAVPGITDGTRFRRVRLFSSGIIQHNVVYKVQFDFAGGDADFKDVYVGVRGVPLLGTVTVGHQYEPMGLETLTSSKVISLLERASVSHLMPERQTGIRFTRRGRDDRFTAAGGVFRTANSYGDAKGNDYAFTGRVVVAPVNEDHGRNLVHLGVSASYRQTDDDSVFSAHARPENPIVPTFLETGDIRSPHHVIVGVEAAVNRGSVSVQGEAAVTRISAPALDDPKLTAWYVQGSWILTGEHRGYHKGTMGGVRPREAFDGRGGAGAWELVARYSTLDFNDGPLQKGRYAVITAGVNWYLNPVTRVMIDFAGTDLDGVGTLNTVMTRFQVAF